MKTTIGNHLKRSGLLIVLLILSAVGSSRAGDWSGFAAIESRAFPQSPLADRQPSIDVSFILAPEFTTVWGGGGQAFSFEGFLRLDQNDGRRTHWDIRDLYWEMIADRWELRAGVHTVFWGGTESQHLVNLLNQTDLVERPDGEAKLGQPMVNLTLVNDWGTLDLFLLTGFRERIYPGGDGRLRPPLEVADEAVYDTGRLKRHLGWAARWFQTIGSFDVGVSHFWGTGRDPVLRPIGGELRPYYQHIQQTGIDLQAITGGWLWKLETIHRSGQGDRFTAMTGGFEYTFSNLKNTGTDIGVLFEYLYDTQGSDALTPFEDDLFAGTRIALNDVQSTEVLAGMIVDRTSGSSLMLLEASRRVRDRWKVTFEMRGFLRTSPDDPLYGLRRDGYAELKMSHHF